MVNTSTLTMHITLTQFKRMWKYAAGQLERPWKTHFFCKREMILLGFMFTYMQCAQILPIERTWYNYNRYFCQFKNLTFDLLWARPASYKWVLLDGYGSKFVHNVRIISLFHCFHVYDILFKVMAGFWQKDIKKISTFVAFYYVPYKSFLFSKEK